MKNHFILILLPLLTMLSACSVEPQPIEYGEDVCHYCKMTIVDRQHAAELVTDKGKVFKFDAIECMVPFLKENADTEFAHMLVSDFQEPGKMLDARTSTFLVSTAIPSPMGANLSAFANEALAKAIQQEKGGTLYSWQTIQLELK